MIGNLEGRGVGAMREEAATVTPVPEANKGEGRGGWGMGWEGRKGRYLHVLYSPPLD